MKNYKAYVTTPIFLALFVLIVTFPHRVKADQSNNPIFATLAEIQQLIVAALSPIQSSLNGLTNRVSNLEATVSPIPSQIASLQTGQNQANSRIGGFEASVTPNTRTSRTAVTTEFKPCKANRYSASSIIWLPL